MMDKHDVAEEIGVTANWIARLAARHNIGTIVRNRYRFDRADVKRLKKIVADGQVGNPNFRK